MKIFCSSLIILVLLSIYGSGQTRHTFSWKNNDFLLNGKPFIIRSGEMHYPRIPRIHWRDRMKKAKAMGLNTISTYVFWNLHEPKPGKFDFLGKLDVAEFIKTAQEEGLYVIIRPGPYVCTEWDFGGLPAWLLKTEDLKIRSTDPRFLDASRRYLLEVGKRVASLQIEMGGNIIMAQIENEYGSFGSDPTYLNEVRKMFLDAGFTVPLFTSDFAEDGGLNGGTLPDVLPVINFGIVTAKDIPAITKQFDILEKFRPGIPRMVGEYWVGWFDHWGAKKRIISAESAAEGVDWMLERGISFNLYMFHGGTSFGFMAGSSNSSKGFFQPDISSYDYDSPLDEAGKTTKKYQLLRETIKKHLPPGEQIPEVPADTRLIEIPEFELRETTNLNALLKNPVPSEKPRSMEEIGQDYGFVLYRKKLGSGSRGTLKFEAVRDYALVFVDGQRVGSLDRRLDQNEITINGKEGSTVDILVENHGRLNIGKDMGLDRKGITGSIRLGSEELKNWQIYSLPLDNLRGLKFGSAQTKRDTPVFYRGSFNLRETGDTYLDMTTWGKGHVWINGHHLGRFWNIGPQQSLFVPANWLKKGRNQVIVLEVNEARRNVIRGIE